MIHCFSSPRRCSRNSMTERRRPGSRPGGPARTGPLATPGRPDWNRDYLGARGTQKRETGVVRAHGGELTAHLQKHTWRDTIHHTVGRCPLDNVRRISGSHQQFAGRDETIGRGPARHCADGQHAPAARLCALCRRATLLLAAEPLGEHSGGTRTQRPTEEIANLKVSLPMPRQEPLPCISLSCSDSARILSICSKISFRCLGSSSGHLSSAINCQSGYPARDDSQASIGTPLSGSHRLPWQYQGGSESADRVRARADSCQDPAMADRFDLLQKNLGRVHIPQGIYDEAVEEVGELFAATDVRQIARETGPAWEEAGHEKTVALC